MAGGNRDELTALAKEFSLWFSEYADKLIPIIEREIATGKPASIAVAIAAEETGIEAASLQKVLDLMLRASELGSGLSFSVPDGIGIRASFLGDFWPGDEMTLSERISPKSIQKRIVAEVSRHLGGSKALSGAVSDWREIARSILEIRGPSGEAVSGRMSKALSEVVRKAGLAAEGDAKAIAGLKSAARKAQAATDRLSAGGAPNQLLRAAYLDVIDAAKSLSDKGLKRAVSNAVREKARYHAERIARTEIARAYGTGFFSEIENDEDVIGFRWRIGGRHPATDICDVHANADFYGMGRGIYPKGRAPRYPAHPHCLCVLTQVFFGEAGEPKKFSAASGAGYIKTLSQEERVSMLGAAGAAKISAWQENLRGWSGHGRPQVYPEAARAISEVRNRDVSIGL